MEKTTKFGKFLRILRIQTGESAQDMAKKLDMSPSYLSTIENGKRNIPDNMENRVMGAYELSEDQKRELRQAMVESSEMVKIDFSALPENKRHVIFELARDDVDDDIVEFLRQAMAEKRGK